EAVIRTDLNELVHSLAAELAMACKKMAIYSQDHPVGRRSLEKPFLLFGKLFGFRKYVSIAVHRGNLYICNICLKEAVYYSPIVQAMQVLDISALLFESSMSIRDFSIFVQRFVKRVRPDDPEYDLAEYLKKNRILSIQVNSEPAFKLIENQRQYRGEVDDDFSVRRLALDQIGNDLTALARLGDMRDDQFVTAGIDFDPAIVRYLLPEKVASIRPTVFRRELEMIADGIRNNTRPGEQIDSAVQTYMSLFKLVNLHPDKERIIENLDSDFGAAASQQRDRIGDVTSTTGAIKTNVISQIDSVIADIFSLSNLECDSASFSDSFERLLKTGLRGKAEEVLQQLMEYLRDANPGYRQKALSLLIDAIGQINMDSDERLLELVAADVVAQISNRRETYEYSELVARVCDRCLVERRYDLIADLAGAMASRRHMEGDVSTYDSMAVKKALQTLNRREVIDRLVDDLFKSDFETAGKIKQILVALASEEVALVLAQVVAHPTRQVRQQSLRVLAELGKAALKVFSRIINDDEWFARDASRQELPDAKWYVVRNSIFVLGSLKDPEAVLPLRLRTSDPDIRVRREIVSALEKIGGEEAVDLLVLMAEDLAREIRESAIAAIGVLGTADVVPLLVDLAKRGESETVKLIGVLGKLGGQEARDFLCHLLEDEYELTAIAAGGVSKDDLRLAAVRALGTIGDTMAIERIRNYQANLPAAHKLFFKNSPVNKAIADILSRH
ncbi:hypothetical protein C3F09_00085, partial [candidate division GN15 bacterium]